MAIVVQCARKNKDDFLISLTFNVFSKKIFDEIYDYCLNNLHDKEYIREMFNRTYDKIPKQYTFKNCLVKFYFSNINDALIFKMRYS